MKIKLLVKKIKYKIIKFLYEYFKKMCSKELERNIQSGVFGADMKVELLNDGPVTIILDSEEIN